MSARGFRKNPMERKPFEIVLLGLTPQGLALLRAFSQIGFSVLAVGRKEDVGIHSRYGKIIRLEQMNDLNHLLEPFLCDAVRIHITSDIFLNHVIDNYYSLFTRFSVYPGYESAIIFRDKKNTAALASTLKIPSPKSFFLDRASLQNYDIFPSIIKWNQTKKPTAFKTAIVHSHEDLQAFLNAIEYTEDLIIQPYIPGGTEVDISYAGFFENGVEQLGIGISQKRQYPSGLSSFVEEYNGKFETRLKAIAYRLMEHTKFSGFVEVECRIDLKNDSLSLIEVNPRACGWIKILMNDFQRVLLHKEISDGKKKASWVNLVRDMRAILSHVRSHGLDAAFVKQVAKDYLGVPVTDIFSVYDPKPFFSNLKNFLPGVTSPETVADKNLDQSQKGRTLAIFYNAGPVFLKQAGFLRSETYVYKQHLENFSYDRNACHRLESDYKLVICRSREDLHPFTKGSKLAAIPTDDWFHKGAICFILEKENHLAAYAWLHRKYYDNLGDAGIFRLFEHEAFVGPFYTDPGHRNKGLYYYLMDLVLAYREKEGGHGFWYKQRIKHSHH